MNNDKFFNACSEGYLEDVLELIRDGFDVNTLSYDETAVMLATRGGHYDIVKTLLDHGVNVDEKDGMGRTALFLTSPNIEVTKLLIERNADLEIKSNKGQTALLYALQTGQPDKAELLINKGVDVDHQDLTMKSALIVASYFNMPHIVELLVKNNATLDLQDLNGDTALMHAITSRIEITAGLLLDKGASLNKVNKYGETAIDVALANKDFMSKILLKHNFINHQYENGSTPLMKACHKTNGEDILYLMSKGAEFNIENNDGDSALKILNRKEDLSEELQALKEKLNLEKMIDTDDYQSMGL